MTDEQFSLRGAPDNKISILQRTIEQLHLNLLILEEKAAKFGPLHVPKGLLILVPTPTKQN